jgi:hypothetical protein
VPFGTVFRDKPEEISLWSPVRSKWTSPETAPFESALSESLVQVVSIYRRASLPASRSPPVNHELVGATEENSGRQVPAQFAAQRALNGDELEREFLQVGSDSGAATLARHDE